MNKAYGQNCPVAKSLDVLGDRWTLLIVRDLLKGKTRFKDLESSLRGIPTNILADRLKLLETSRVVERVYYSEHPPRAEYRLTARGEELGSVITAIAMWGARNLCDETPFSVVHTGCGHKVEQEWVCEKCGRDVNCRRVQFDSIRPVEQAS
ncbi:MAG: helix-turn-helix domain-containing protein [Chloroflexi bacterium]|nr:helix-turn-helix domain-containing protein [Chloroflexota bacterium]